MSKVFTILAILMLLSLGAMGNEVELAPGPDIGQDTWISSYYPDENFGEDWKMIAY